MARSEQDDRLRRTHRVLPRILISMACGVLASLPAVAEPAYDRTAALARPTMNQIFGVIQILLPRVMDTERFADPAERQTIAEQLANLSEAAAELELHAAGETGVGFHSLSASMAQSVDRAHEQFGRGDVDGARKSLRYAMQACVGCHSRKPSTRRFELAERLTEGEWMMGLTPNARAHVQVLVRRFDEALTAWEEVIADPDVASAVLDFAGVLGDYLTIAIRGTGEVGRARTTLVAFSQRGDLPIYLQNLVRIWIDSLAHLEATKQLPRTLSQAKALIARGGELTPWPYEGASIVYDLAASSILNEVVDTAAGLSGERVNDDKIALAESLYLLGAVESRIESTALTPKTIDHLAAAIRIDPLGPFALKAFSLLEKEVLQHWGTLLHSALPQPLARMLDELKPMAVPAVSGAEKR